MFKRLKNLLITKGKHEPDKSLMIAVFVLIIFGLIMLSSASSVVSYATYGNIYHFLWRQLAALAVGLVAWFIFSRLDYHLWRKYAVMALFVSLGLLILVFIPGLKSNSGTAARSWINVFGFSFQPSELVKLTFLVYLATWLEAKKGQLSSFAGGFFPFIVIMGVVSLLMMAQPDFGTLFIIAFTSLIVFFVGGAKFSHILIIILLAALLLFLMLSFKSSYRDDRFKCLQNPGYSPQDKCYQINQSLIAVGSGGWFGRGLGQSRQKFMYLPEVWSDAIFPIIAEEIGFVFCVLLILLFFFIFYRGLMIARAAPDAFGQLLATGIVAWFGVQTFLNIGGMINLIPMTCVPLPFVSAGGRQTKR
ncbi:MAG: putative peptidoglycan glycosyltransferase FtsW [Candidatus Falkowbacteria bacterium]|nr:putative peptidoglycan glycosyltransferase FtsW [Candidatus Falkowbacteria bacterium]